ncbi:hypothetical protein SERLADRAFT_367183 [Serpula lacrymans var. lacrymans S7.9]|uniref:Uncharacterized protein n=1 Tax=Serpula lacrymans var. lacrymans (strain S7.9) TaxID=578457 RepID=F8NNU5_SERL9|nr:uncharacterized protein SERLADRAFT_367183 [Serpula lacrymans var. lacrymans S7.9]EGO27617.1 hypothetical protein SERLADRAFT_367183 [Serpula lacrymans var. lacrymans S7.9]
MYGQLSTCRPTHGSSFYFIYHHLVRGCVVNVSSELRNGFSGKAKKVQREFQWALVTRIIVYQEINGKNLNLD